MLSKEQKEKLRKIHIYELASEEKKGKAIVRKLVPKGKKNKEKSWKEVVFKIPSTYEILEDVIVRILANDFTKVERVAPANANCIIRIFQKLHYNYDSSMMFNLYGADVFVRNGNKWISNSEDNGSIFYLDHSKCLVGQWLYQDEQVIFDTDFVDIYVNVSAKENQE